MELTGAASIIPPTWFFIVALALIAAMFGLLMTVLGWIFNKVYTKIDEIAQSLRAIEVDLHGKISDLDRRVAIVELRSDLAFRGKEPRE